MWHDGGMSKRSRKIAKRNEFENAMKEVEEKIRSRHGKDPAAIAPAGTGERDGESGKVEPAKGK